MITTNSPYNTHVFQYTQNRMTYNRMSSRRSCEALSSINTTMCLLEILLYKGKLFTTHLLGASLYRYQLTRTFGDKIMINTNFSIYSGAYILTRTFNNKQLIRTFGGLNDKRM